jgi:phosphatidylinositol glycan class M
MTKTRAALCAIVWAGTQALWLSEAYKLEFLGQNVFVALWMRGLVYVIGNCWIIAGIMDSYETKEVDGDAINERDSKTYLENHSL